MDAKIVIGVPGKWPTRSDLLAAMVKANGADYVLAGITCFESATKLIANVEVYDRSPDLVTAFTAAGQGLLTKECLAEVAAHTMTPYVLFPVTTQHSCLDAVRFVDAFLRSGGVAIKVETAGIAHEKDHWLGITSKARDSVDLYPLLVILVRSQDIFYSCGMQNYGLPDASIPSWLPMQSAADTLATFNTFSLVDHPMLNAGETFSCGPEEPRYRLSLGPAPKRYGEDSPLHNPHGMWLLTPIP